MRKIWGYVLAVVVLITIGGGLIFYFSRGKLQPAGVLHGTESPASSSLATQETPKPLPRISLELYGTRRNKKLILRWNDLPSETEYLNIFRSPAGRESWSLWKTISIASSSRAEGVVEIAVESGFDYSYYVEAARGGAANGTSTNANTNGQILWTSSSTQPVILGETPPSTAPSSTPTIGAQQPGNGTGTPANGGQNQNQAGAQSSTPASVPNSPAENTNPSGTITYYTPQVQISATSTAQTGTFWVQHTDNQIEIAWQNLPPETRRLVIFRSANQSGPWVNVLTQTSPYTMQYSLKLVDEALHSPHYYKMEIFTADNTLISSYGPVYLPAL